MIYLHVDVDNLWMYEKEFGINIHPDSEYIYKHSLPLFLKLLKKSRTKATFMIIGQDLKLPACQAFCRKAVSEGHEIGNHTWSHPILFGKLTYEQKKKQILQAHQAITKACGREPVGFRGPGYYQDKDIVTILQKLHYQYDSSILPGFAPFLMKGYALMKGGKNRYKTFGRTQDVFSREGQYLLKGNDTKGDLWELPISVLPQVRLPIHPTFAYIFGSWYRKLLLQYFEKKPKYLLYLVHVIDFVDLPKQNRNHPVIPLRYSFRERMQFLEDVIGRLVQINGKGLQTSRDFFISNRH